jgi:AcrR family transcriptional regulator
MPRTVNEEDFNIKRNQILDSALKFIYSIGYEQMSIQNIIDDLGISKGAFYHYFTSKEDLLVGIIDRLADDIFEQINPIVVDGSLTGLEKMNRYFNKASFLKLEHVDVLLPLMKVWYQDENLMVREKLTETSCRIIAPILTRIIQQGIRDGDFKNNYTDIIGEVIYRIFIDMGNSVADQMLVKDVRDYNDDVFNEKIRVYTRVIENILGAEQGALHIIPEEAMERWKVIFLGSIRADLQKVQAPAR